MKIFKELKKLGYKHYTEHTVEELDDLLLNSKERIMEQSLVLRWFREKYGFCTIIPPSINNDFSPVIWTLRAQYHIGVFNTYEEAEQACLKRLIEIINENKKD